MKERGGFHCISAGEVGSPVDATLIDSALLHVNAIKIHTHNNLSHHMKGELAKAWTRLRRHSLLVALLAG